MKRLTEILVVALLAAPFVGAGEDWPMFRGDAQLTGARDGSLGPELKPLWVFEAEEGFEASAAIVAGVAYVGSLDGKLYAVDVADGSLRWSYDTGEEIKSSPAVFDGLVYFGDGAGTFHAVDAESGKAKFTFEAEAEIVSSPNRVGDRIVFGSHDQYIYCLDAKTGALAWKVETDGYVYATPAVVGDAIVSAGCDGLLRIIRVSDGKEIVQVELDGYTGASPAIKDGRLYVGTFENEVLGVDLEARKVMWRYEHPERKFPYLSSAALGDGVVVLGGRDKMVHALDAGTGKARWTFATRGKVDASPLIVGERVLTASVSGELFLLDLVDGKVVWTFDSGSSFTASPSIAGGRVVIGTLDGQLYAFGSKESP